MTIGATASPACVCICPTAGPTGRFAGTWNVTCPFAAESTVAAWPPTVSATAPDAAVRLGTFTSAVPPAGAPRGFVAVFMTGGVMATNLAGAAVIRNACGIDRNWSPVLTVRVVDVNAAPGLMVTFASSRFGPVTQICRIATSLDPKPIAVCPSIKAVLTPSISTIASDPAGREEGYRLEITGVGSAALYVNTGPPFGCTSSELWLSPFSVTTFAV